MPAAVLAQVCWPAARTNLPGGPLTLVSLPGPQLMGLSVELNTVGIRLPRATWEPGNSNERLTFLFSLGRGSLGPRRVVGQGGVAE